MLSGFYARAIGSLDGVISYPLIYYRGVDKYFKNKGDQAKIIEGLQFKIVKLEYSLAKMHQLELENKLLVEKHDYSDIKGNWHIARVIPTVFLDGRILPLNRGSDDGLAIGNAVIGNGRIIGQIINLTRHSAQMKTLDSQDLEIQVSIPDKNFIGIMRANGAGNSFIDNVVTIANLEIGDIIYASGLDNIYPANFPVGEIESLAVNKDTGYSVIKVDRSLNLPSLSWVYVYIPDH